MEMQKVQQSCRSRASNAVTEMSTITQRVKDTKLTYRNRVDAKLLAQSYLLPNIFSLKKRNNEDEWLRVIKSIVWNERMDKVEKKGKLTVKVIDYDENICKYTITAKVCFRCLCEECECSEYEHTRRNK
jgi:hypothetical protein